MPSIFLVRESHLLKLPYSSLFGRTIEQRGCQSRRGVSARCGTHGIQYRSMLTSTLVDVVWPVAKQIGSLVPYHRGHAIWLTSSQALSILSFATSTYPLSSFVRIVSAFLIPQAHEGIAVVYESDGSEKRVCIDGKQRLTSIQKCVTSHISVRTVLIPLLLARPCRFMNGIVRFIKLNYLMRRF